VTSVGSEGSASVADGIAPQADRLARDFAAVHDLATEAFLIGSALDLESFKGSSEAFFQDRGETNGRLETLAAQATREQDVRPIGEALAALRSHFLGPDGIVAKKMELLTSVGIFNARSKRLGELLTGYNDVLAGVETAVGSASDRARSETASIISRALWVVTALVALSVLIAIGAAIFLTRHISRPLARLTGHLLRMKGRDDLPEIGDPALLNASDELGQLSGAFNRMIRELTAARKELIAKSEAEISKQVQRLDRIAFLSQRLELLVNDLLYFSRLGRHEMALQATDLNAAIHDIASLMEETLTAQNATILLPDLLPEVICNKTRVAEVFRNLIVNAIKYNDKPEKTVEIGCISNFKAPHGLARRVFYVRDNGIGIEAEYHDEIFRIFRRLNQEDDSRRGTGVGLTFVQKIIHRHGGHIWLQSTPGEGTTFYFTLEPEIAYAAA
jgi:signal transduction histidine kinase